jgi:hypothetical protein
VGMRSSPRRAAPLSAGELAPHWGWQRSLRLSKQRDAGATARTVAEMRRAAARVRPPPTTLAPPRTTIPRTAIPTHAMEVLRTPAASGGRRGPLDNVTGGVVVPGTPWGPRCAIGSTLGGSSESIVIDWRAKASTSNGGGVVGRSSDTDLDRGYLLGVIVDSWRGQKQARTQS